MIAALVLAAGTNGGQETQGQASREAIDHALAQARSYLLAHQEADGGFGSLRDAHYPDLWENVEAHRAFRVATTGLCARALLSCSAQQGDSTSERDVEARAAALRTLPSLLADHDLRRCDDWDIDTVWGLLFGMQGLVALVADKADPAKPALLPALLNDEQRGAAATAIDAMIARIWSFQSPLGGWGYYCDQIDAWQPNWATSFTTAAMVIALDDARKAGFAVDAKRFDAAVEAIAHCELPSGAFTYNISPISEPGSLESLDDVRGSLGRIAACQLALTRGGRRPSDEKIAAGYGLFLRHHQFLDIARMRPVPHEAYHYNASYFFLFGHCHAAALLPELTRAAQRDVAPRIAQQIVAIQEDDGACWDDYFAGYTRASGTAFALLTLADCRRALRHTVAPELRSLRPR